MPVPGSITRSRPSWPRTASTLSSRNVGLPCSRVWTKRIETSASAASSSWWSPSSSRRRRIASAQETGPFARSCITASLPSELPGRQSLDARSRTSIFGVALDSPHSALVCAIAHIVLIAYGRWRSRRLAAAPDADRRGHQHAGLALWRFLSYRGDLTGDCRGRSLWRECQGTPQAGTGGPDVRDRRSCAISDSRSRPSGISPAWQRQRRQHGGR